MLKKQIVLFVVSSFIWNLSFAQKSADSLIIFIGEKIAVRPLDFEPTSQITLTKVVGRDTIKTTSTQTILDLKYIAKYKVLKIFNGHYKADTIEFVAWDHYGIPQFSKFKHVLLFVYPQAVGLIHEKYQYFDVYLAKNEKWAAPYAHNEYNGPFKNQITIKAEKIKFNDDLSFNLKERYDYPVSREFTEPYYQIKSKIAVPIYGNYAEDLIEIKKQGVLKASGFYK